MMVKSCADPGAAPWTTQMIAGLGRSESSKVSQYFVGFLSRPPSQ